MLPDTILNKCSDFLLHSKNRPVYKPLPVIGDGFRRVKIRKKTNYAHQYDKIFDRAFSHKRKDLRLRSLLVQTREISTGIGLENFYIFPPNGYKILYNEQINDHDEYFGSLENIISDAEMAGSILENLFRIGYKEGSISDAIDSGSNVVIYNIPYYYAIRKSLIEDYRSFLEN